MRLFFSEHRDSIRRASLLTALALAAILGNYLAIPLFFGVDLLLGSIATLIVVQLFGGGFGVAVALAASLYTYVLWGHPYAVLAFTLEALVVALVIARRRANLVVADAFYWIVIGAPLVLLTYSGTMDMEWSAGLLIALKQAINGLCNALVANILVDHSPLRRFASKAHDQAPRFQQLLFNFLASAMILPAMTLLVMEGRHAMADIERDLGLRTKLVAEGITGHLNSWLASRMHAVEDLASYTANADPGDRESLERYVAIVHRLHPAFLNMYVADAKATAIAFDPPINDRGEPTGGLNFADRPYFEIVRRTKKPFVSSVFSGRGGTFRNIVTISAPVLRDGAFDGFALGAVDLVQVENILRSQASVHQLEAIILDDAQHVVSSTTGTLQTGAPLRSRAGSAVPLADAQYRWMPAGKQPAMARWRDARFGTRRTLPASGWGVLVEAPLAPELARLNARYMRGFGATLSWILLSLAVTALLTNWVTGPLHELAEVSTRLPERLEANAPVTIPRPRVAELASLADNIETMILALKQRLLERKQSEEAMRLLAQTTVGLVETLDPPLLLREVVHAVVPSLADGCIGVLSSTPAVCIVKHEDPSRQAALEHCDLGALLEHDARTAPVMVVSPTPNIGVGARESQLRVLLQARGRTLGVLMLVRDRAGDRWEDVRPLLEQIAGRAGLALDNARLHRELEEADRAKDNFLAMLGHELRNPLAPIVTALELLRKERADLPRLRGIIERQVQQLVRLVDDLLDVARITRGKIELRKERTDLVSLTRATAEAVRPTCERKRQSMTTTFCADELWVDGDPARLQQVLQNLFHNATKYTQTGGHIAIEVSRVSARANLRVQDDGMGMPPELTARVFDLFVQGKQSLERSAGGLGIGLTLARELVRLHGGDVSARSEGPGRGSVFEVELPLAEPAAKDASSASELARERRRIRLVVVEDNLDAAALIAELARSWNHEVMVCHDGLSGLETIARFGPDVALLDIGLPGIDGYELARRIRATPSLSRIRLVALTGYGQKGDRERARAAGFDVHLTKPVDPSLLDHLLTTPAERTS